MSNILAGAPLVLLGLYITVLGSGLARGWSWQVIITLALSAAGVLLVFSGAAILDRDWGAARTLLGLTIFADLVYVVPVGLKSGLSVLALLPGLLIPVAAAELLYLWQRGQSDGVMVHVNVREDQADVKQKTPDDQADSRQRETDPTDER